MLGYLFRCGRCKLYTTKTSKICANVHRVYRKTHRNRLLDAVWMFVVDCQPLSQTDRSWPDEDDANKRQLQLDWRRRRLYSAYIALFDHFLVLELNACMQLDSTDESPYNVNQRSDEQPTKRRWGTRYFTRIWCNLTTDIVKI